MHLLCKWLDSRSETSQFQCIVIITVHCMLFAHTASMVEQVFPANVDYCCHCPNIKLKCTFSKNPVTAFWSALINGRDPELVTPSTPGHTVNTSEIQNGTLYLMVNSSVYSEGNQYSCTAVFPGDKTEVAGSFPIPMAEGEFRLCMVIDNWDEPEQAPSLTSSTVAVSVSYVHLGHEGKF